MSRSLLQNSSSQYGGVFGFSTNNMFQAQGKHAGEASDEPSTAVRLGVSDYMPESAGGHAVSASDDR